MQSILNKLASPQNLIELTRIKRGIERECLRLDCNGTLAQTPHPTALGSALCHPNITTDFSESLLEFVTPAFTGIDDCLNFLKTLHQFTYLHIGDENIWMNSMPCILPGVTNIPIARYGASNIGRMKHIYRKGLSMRYGSAMQTISGIHYNFSVSRRLLDNLYEKNVSSQQISNLYMGLIRNFHRHCWVVLYLFGASPAVCKSFLSGHSGHGLKAFDTVSYYGPDATTLRMSDLGYRNPAQSSIKIDLTNVERYIRTLRKATETPWPACEKNGLKSPQGEYQQLNTHILQIENEYYTVIRPKQVADSGEKPSCALRQRGIGYVEVRCLDINPDSAVGISDDQIRFMDTLLLYCLFSDSPAISEAEKNEISETRTRIVRKGREKQLQIPVNGGSVSARAAMAALMDKLAPIARLLDQAHDNNLYSRTLADQKTKVLHVETTPSARIVDEMRRNHESFFEYALRKTLQHKQSLQEPLPAAALKALEGKARQSLAHQEQRESSDAMSFEDYLQHYFHETLPADYGTGSGPP